MTDDDSNETLALAILELFKSGKNTNEIAKELDMEESLVDSLKNYAKTLPPV